MNRVVFVSLTILFLLSLSSITGLIQLVKAEGGTITINADGSITPSTAPITTVDNITYTFTTNIINESIVVQRDNIVLDGVGFTIQGDGTGNGIDLSNRTNVAIENMTIKAFETGIGLNSSSEDIIFGNNITANTLYGIVLHSSSNNVLSGNNVANNGYGIYFDSSSNNILSLNNVTANNYEGIWLDYSSGNALVGNNVANNHNGIDLISSSNNNLNDNNVTANIVYGIFLGSSSNCTLSGNNAANSEYGIELFSSSDNNVLSGNNVTANIFYGIGLGSSSNNTLSGNNLMANEHGIGLGSSSNNTINHNNFINNNFQVWDNDSTNVWDNGYPSGGNYWSDYNGTDVKNGSHQNETGSDGIGDTPYIIDANNTDYFPLMGMFSSFVTPQGYSVNIISNSTISGFVAPIEFGHYVITALTFNVTGTSGSTGFCRVSFPTAMMNGTYYVSVNGTEVPYILLPCSNANASYLYFTYKHSTEQVIILPEFPSSLVLSLFMIATLLAVMIYKKERQENKPKLDKT